MSAADLFPLLLDRGEDEGEESKFKPVSLTIAILRIIRLSLLSARDSRSHREKRRFTTSTCGWARKWFHSPVGSCRFNTPASSRNIRRVRNNVGIFDISHMGQLIVDGAGAREWLNTMLTNNIDKLDVGIGQYTFLLNERGGIIDDLIVYRISERNVSARCERAHARMKISPGCKSISGRAIPVAQRRTAIAAPCKLENRSADFGGVAIQGPAHRGAISQPFRRRRRASIAKSHCRSSIRRNRLFRSRALVTPARTAIEVFFRATDAVKFWNAALEKGKPFGIKPCGLGARDTLRLEMCYPLNGSDLSPERNPIEAGLGFFVDLTKPNFIGRDACLKTKEIGPREKLVPFRMKEKGPPPRPHYAVFENGERIGEVTSGTLSPSLNWGVGMAYVSAAHAKIGAQIDIEIRGQKFPGHHRKETALQEISIMNVPDDLLYTESHEWIKREGENVRVGITDHAQSELTDVVYVELPKMDRQANAKEAIAIVESVKAASDIYAPVKGTVVEVNKALEADPGLINREPYGQGWIFVLKIDNADDLKNLKDAEAYRKQIE